MPPNPRALVEFFARSLTSFTTSGEAFRILCTLPHPHSPSTPPQPRPPQHPIRNLIVLDSSFNPPTTAHAAMVRAAAAAASSSPSGTRILLLLAVENADKPPRPASFPLCLGMMEALGRELLLGGGDGGVSVDLGVTRMPFFHDKARAIAESGCYGDYDGSPGGGGGGGAGGGGGGGVGEMTFLAGYDTLVRIFQPRYYGGEEGMRAALDPFFARARLRVTMRTDGEWGGREEQEEFVRELAEEGGKLDEVGGRREWMRKVDLVDGFGGDVSSSRVRGVVRTGGYQELDGLVGGEVKAWIEREGLYRE
ncbi:hypothetical protein ACO1O0_006614 [Amphichorda felina]